MEGQVIRDDLGGVFLAVISHKRTGNLAKMAALIGPATWFVGEGERAAYEQAGAAHVIESGGLCRSRNAALDAAFALERACIQLSDDLKAIKDGDDKAKPMPFETAVRRLWGSANMAGASLAGAAPTANLFYYNPRKPLTTDGFVVGDFIFVRPGPLRFDEGMRLKEDYDYTLQHLEAYGKVARVNSLLLEFAHRTNKGGAVDYRTAELEAEAIAHLKRKWPGCIVDNPRRPNEVLLRWRSRTLRG